MWLLWTPGTQESCYFLQCVLSLPSFLHCSAQAQRHHWQIAALIIVPCCTGKRRMAVGFCFLSFYLSFLLSFFIPTLFSLCSLCLCSLHIWMLATLTWETTCFWFIFSSWPCRPWENCYISAVITNSWFPRHVITLQSQSHSSGSGSLRRWSCNGNPEPKSDGGEWTPGCFLIHGAHE